MSDKRKHFDHWRYTKVQVARERCIIMDFTSGKRGPKVSGDSLILLVHLRTLLLASLRIKCNIQRLLSFTLRIQTRIHYIVLLRASLSVRKPLNDKVTILLQFSLSSYQLDHRSTVSSSSRLTRVITRCRQVFKSLRSIRAKQKHAVGAREPEGACCWKIKTRR